MEIVQAKAILLVTLLDEESCYVGKPDSQAARQTRETVTIQLFRLNNLRCVYHVAHVFPT